MVVASSRPARPPAHARGFTLVEVAISLVLVAGLLMAAASTVGTTAGLRRVQVDHSLSNAIAQDLAGEIVRCRYEDPDGPNTFGPEADEPSRDHWDDVDDYHDWLESPPADRSGRPLPGLTGWMRHAEIAYADSADPMAETTDNADTGLKRITVTVTAPDGNVAAFVGLRSRLGSFDQDPVMTSTLVTWVGVTMQVGPDPDRAVSTGVHIANQLPQTD